METDEKVIANRISGRLAKELGIQVWQVEAVVSLLDEGATIPFIARYRKEKHGELDDTKLRDLAEGLTRLRNLEQRRQEISESLQKLEKWTEELQAQIDSADEGGTILLTSDRRPLPARPS